MWRKAKPSIPHMAWADDQCFLVGKGGDLMMLFPCALREKVLARHTEIAVWAQKEESKA